MQVLFLDEISTGLDSSTTYQIIKYLRDTTHFLSYTTLIALLQPAPETYDLFDDILLLSGGAHLPKHRPAQHLTTWYNVLYSRLWSSSVRDAAAYDCAPHSLLLGPQQHPPQRQSAYCACPSNMLTTGLRTYAP